MKNFNMSINSVNPVSNYPAPSSQPPFEKNITVSMSVSFNNELAAIMFSNELINLIKNANGE